jgi:hypothetical protein
LGKVHSVPTINKEALSLLMEGSASNSHLVDIGKKQETIQNNVQELASSMIFQYFHHPMIRKGLE